MHRPLHVLALLTALVGLHACASTPTCTPNASLPCACTDGRMGAQLCLADRTLGACVCTTPPTDAGTDVPPSPMDVPSDIPEADISQTDTQPDISQADIPVDEGRECMLSQTRPCYDGPGLTRGVGRCRDGVQSCDVAGRWLTTCPGQVLPNASEICTNAIDDDWDGMVDESCGAAVAEVVAGFYSNCVRMNDGTVRCWGANSQGELGDGTTAPHWTPVEIAGLAGVAQLASGGGGFCAVMVDATVRCWGGNQFGQLGMDSTSTCVIGTVPYLCERRPAVIRGLTDVVGIAMGPSHTCSRHRDGSVRCWGGNQYGQLGFSTMTTCSTPGASDIPCTSVPTVVPGWMGADQLALAFNHTCGRFGSPGSVRCLGFNANGELGDGTIINRTSPTTVVGVTSAIQLSTERDASHVLLADRTVMGWGRGEALGIPIPGAVTPPRAVMGLSNVDEVASGQNHSCARMMDGTIQCWGSNREGELGVDSIAGSGIPVTVPGLTGTVSLTPGASHNCVLRSDGAVYCWGRNVEGQLGDGTTMTRTGPTRVLF